MSGLAVCLGGADDPGGLLHGLEEVLHPRLGVLRLVLVLVAHPARELPQGEYKVVVPHFLLENQLGIEKYYIA